MKRLFYLTILASSLLVSCSSDPLQIELPSIFQDNMVIQRDREVVLWGKAGPGDEFEVRSSWGAEATAVANDTGEWEVYLEGVEAGGPHTITLGKGTSRITIDNILSGEVWLASGQSNMEMPLKGWPPNDTINYSSKEISGANYPDIRMFTVQRTVSAVPMEDVTGSWEICDPGHAGDFSASAYFFARELYRELNVPVGIIHSSWGGTPAEAWVSRQGLQALGDFDAPLRLMARAEEMKDEADAWLAGLDKSDIDRLDMPDAELNDAPLREKDYEDGGWDSMELPAFWEQGSLPGFDGIVWFRKDFTFEGDPSTSHELKIGAIDDMDITYINGIEVGRTTEDGMWTEQRIYNIAPGTLMNGQNTIAVKVFDGAGGGGIHSGDMSIGELSLAGDWKYRPVAEYRNGTLLKYGSEGEAFENRPEAFGLLDPNAPATLYNGMIAPVIHYPIRGAIWYQGESNVGRDEQYERLFPALISDWRRIAGQDFPFYFVQIAPYTYGGDEQVASARLRDAQRKTLSLENTGMVVSMDIGNVRNIHPSNKQDVGKRLALLALANTYGISGIEYSGPLPISAETQQNSLVISFSNADSGLVLEDGGVFELAGPDGVFHPAEARVEGEDLLLRSSLVTEPVMARYAFRNVTEAYLFNGAGLPASSFEIDSRSE